MTMDPQHAAAQPASAQQPDAQRSSSHLSSQQSDVTTTDRSGQAGGPDAPGRPGGPHIDLARVRQELYPAVLADVLDGIGRRGQCLATGIQPLTPDQVLLGYAFPVAIERVYDVPERPFRGLTAALDALGPDDVFVTPTQRASDIAVWGELLTTAAKQRGAAGALTDGLVRDTKTVRALDFPVFSAGTVPLDSLGRHEITRHGVACVVDGVRIEPGDLVFGDSDGVVIVPGDLIETVVELGFEKRASEVGFRSAVASGMSATEAFATFGVL